MERRSTFGYLFRYYKIWDFFPKAIGQNEAILEANSNSDWCRDRVERGSTFCYLFRYLNAPISWYAKRQKVVAHSSCEVQYIVAFETTC